MLLPPFLPRLAASCDDRAIAPGERRTFLFLDIPNFTLLSVDRDARSSRFRRVPPAPLSHDPMIPIRDVDFVSTACFARGFFFVPPSSAKISVFFADVSRDRTPSSFHLWTRGANVLSFVEERGDRASPLGHDVNPRRARKGTSLCLQRGPHCERKSEKERGREKDLAIGQDSKVAGARDYAVANGIPSLD